MIYLFIHQNFPGQYRHIVSHLAKQGGNRIYFVTQPNRNEIRGVTKIVYAPDLAESARCHPFTVEFDAAVRTGLAVAEQCAKLRDSGIRPDLIIGHAGWGETLFVGDVFPGAPILAYLEFFYHLHGADVGFDPEFSPRQAGDAAHLTIRNAVNRLTFAGCTWGHTPTRWQRSLYPPDFQPRLSVIHEGVDTELVRPDPEAWIRLARGERILTRKDEVITYVARNLEPYRGFPTFMRALPEVLRRRPRAHVLIVGGDAVSYGDPCPGGLDYRTLMLREVGAAVDLDRVHFLGQISYEAYLNLLQVSSVHVYLTYPFVLSWSFLEAMSAGCLIVGSATSPVLEVLKDRENGLAVDFFSAEQVSERVIEALEKPDRHEAIRRAARDTAVRDFDFASTLLPQWRGLFDCLIRGEEPPTLPVEIGPGLRP